MRAASGGRQIAVLQPNSCDICSQLGAQVVTWYGILAYCAAVWRSSSATQRCTFGRDCPCTVRDAHMGIEMSLLLLHQHIFCNWLESFFCTCYVVWQATLCTQQRTHCNVWPHCAHNTAGAELSATQLAAPPEAALQHNASRQAASRSQASGMHVAKPQAHT